jgi:isoleucyl-tRNA synthetase
MFSRMIAPILSFTADEIWGAIPAIVRSRCFCPISVMASNGLQNRQRKTMLFGAR